MMASAYIGDRMDEFAGSYVLTLAGYNAGPGRARQWMREFGDPRDPGVDPIDWIERIPFEETREYVKKVLANMQVYRARLGEAARPRCGWRATSSGRRVLPAGARAMRARRMAVRRMARPRFQVRQRARRRQRTERLRGGRATW